MVLRVVVGHHHGAAVDGHAGMEETFPVLVGMAEDVGGAKGLLVEFERLFGAIHGEIRRDRLHGSPPLCVSTFPCFLKRLKSALLTSA
jgi:hypothetical protein